MSAVPPGLTFGAAARKPRGLARRIYLAFLVAAVLPTAIAGLIGVYVSLDTLRHETLRNLQQEVSVRATGAGTFFDQLAAELRYLAQAPALEAARRAPGATGAEALRALERDYAALAASYPHIYQLRLIDAAGREVVRVDRKDRGIDVVPRDRLQDKSDRYYVREALAHAPGELYVSPLDLNIEHGKIELPERPVIRVAIALGRGTRADGMLIVNLHADILLGALRRMAEGRAGTAYLFDRSGHFLAQRGGDPPGGPMQPVAQLASAIGEPAVARVLAGGEGTQSAGGHIVAHAAIPFGPAYPRSGGPRWVMALSFPEQVLLDSVFNLYVLYAVLTISLVVTAVGGYALSRHLLRPLEALAAETEALAAGNFAQRVDVRGRDEIADLGHRFNAMAGRIEQLVGSLAAHNDRLEGAVRERTEQLRREQEERREIDRQMFQVEKMATLGELAMGVAHEIGNPLAGMKAVAQALQYEDDLAPGVIEALRRLEAETDRLASFLHGIHGFAASPRMNLAPCPLAEVVDDVLFWVRKEARARGIEISLALPSDLPPLRADRTQLKQVLLNLLVNAEHAMPGGGRLEIGAARDGQRVDVTIRDNGCGIEADVLPRIFQPFFTTRSGGTGLGLSVVAKIVRDHGAEITVTSVTQAESPVGHGTCFTLSWPIADMP